MAPERTTRSTLATTTPTTTFLTNEQLKRLIDQGVANALAEIEANQSRNGDGCHDSRTGVRRPVQVVPGFSQMSTLKFQSCSCNAMEETEKDDDRQVLPKG
ncbi:hypothetical protein Tco_0063433 [Tanacetum coccineum]